MSTQLHEMKSQHSDGAIRQWSIPFDAKIPVEFLLDPDESSQYVVVGAQITEKQEKKEVNGKEKWVGTGEQTGYDLYVTSVASALVGFLRSDMPLGDAKFIVHVDDVPASLKSRIGKFDPDLKKQDIYNVSQHFDTVFTLDAKQIYGQAAIPKSGWQAVLRFIRFDGELLEITKKEVASGFRMTLDE